MGVDGIQSFQRCPDVPAPRVPAVAANTAPMFASNMSMVSLPEDLPVGEYKFLCPDHAKPSPIRGPRGLLWACSPSLQLHSTSWPKDVSRSFFSSAFWSKTLTQHQIIKTHPREHPSCFPSLSGFLIFPGRKYPFGTIIFLLSHSLAHLSPSLAIFFFFFLNRQREDLRLSAFHGHISSEVDTFALLLLSLYRYLPSVASETGFPCTVTIKSSLLK